MNKNKLLIVGDTHFRDFLSYDSYINNGRSAEKKKYLILFWNHQRIATI